MTKALKSANLQQLTMMMMPDSHGLKKLLSLPVPSSFPHLLLRRGWQECSLALREDFRAEQNRTEASQSFNLCQVHAFRIPLLFSNFSASDRQREEPKRQTPKEKRNSTSKGRSGRVGGRRVE